MAATPRETLELFCFVVEVLARRTCAAADALGAAGVGLGAIAPLALCSRAAAAAAAAATAVVAAVVATAAAGGCICVLVSRREYEQCIRSGQVDENAAERILKQTYISHLSTRFLTLAYKEARRRHGHLIFRHGDGRYGLHFEPTLFGSEKGRGYTKDEQILLEVLNDLRKQDGIL